MVNDITCSTNIKLIFYSHTTANLVLRILFCFEWIFFFFGNGEFSLLAFLNQLYWEIIYVKYIHFKYIIWGTLIKYMHLCDQYYNQDIKYFHYPPPSQSPLFSSWSVSFSSLAIQRSVFCHYKWDFPFPGLIWMESYRLCCFTQYNIFESSMMSVTGVHFFFFMNSTPS